MEKALTFSKRDVIEMCKFDIVLSTEKVSLVILDAGYSVFSTKYSFISLRVFITALRLFGSVSKTSGTISTL